MTRKLTKLLLVAFMTLTSMAAPAYDIEVDGIYYNIFAATKTAKVTFGDNEYSGIISIPKTVEYANYSLIVDGIDTSAFKDCSSLTFVELSDNITVIEPSAFENCSLLTEIKLPESITNIGSGAFLGCSLLKSINLPENISSIGAETFQNCSSLTEIKLPESITSIGSGAFSGCSMLKSIKLPENISSIGAETFQNCSSLTEIKLPESITSIGSGAFRDCNNIYEINIPDKVTVVNDYTFYGCKNLEKILLPTNLKTIGKSAFYGCESLKDLDMPNSITSIGDGAFSGCSFEFLSISSGINLLTGTSLWGCNKINTLEFKPSSEPLKLGNYSYYSNGQTSSGGWVLCSWETLNVKHLIIGRPIQYLSKYHKFYWGSAGNSKSYDYDFNSPLIKNKNIETLSLTNNFVFKTNNAYESESKTPYSYSWTWDGSFYIENLPNLKQLFIYCDNVTEFSQGLIVKCPNLENIVMNGITVIEKNCFKDFSSLNNIQLNDIVTIKNDAFLGCTSLKEIEFPESLKSLSNSIVSCPLETITLNSKTPPTCEDFPSNIYLSCILNVPNDYIESYQSSSPWKNFWNINGFKIEAETIDITNISGKGLEIAIGDTYLLNAIVLPKNATDKIISWTSSDENVATVSEDGLVTGISIGTATITASCGDVSATCEVTVTEVLAESIILNENEISLNENESFQLKATVVPENTTDKSILWTSSDENVATVSEDGLVTGISVGTATLTASCGDVSATCEITVVENNEDKDPEEDGIEAVLMDSDYGISVYSLQGFLIKGNCTIDDLNEFPKGVYIVITASKSYKISI